MKFRTKVQDVDAVPVADLLRNAVMRWDHLPEWVHDHYEDGGLVLGNGNVIVRCGEERKEAKAADWVWRDHHGIIGTCPGEVFDLAFEAIE